jgi:hypothetical protein
MNKLIDKLIVFVLCGVSYSQFEGNVYDIYIVVPVICAVIAGALMTYLEHDVWNPVIFLACCAAAAFYPAFLFFLPLFCYDLFQTRRQYILLFALVPASVGFSVLPLRAYVYLVLFAALAYLIKLRTASLEKNKKESIALRDNAKEFALQLEQKNNELMEKQDYEVNLATLNERNRIARDIHDSIGHTLSNAILQTGALMAISRDEEMRGKLNTLKDTLVSGMDSVRESVHGLYEESVDLFAEVRELTDGFQFCDITLDYDVESNPAGRILALTARGQEGQLLWGAGGLGRLIPVFFFFFFFPRFGHFLSSSGSFFFLYVSSLCRDKGRAVQNNRHSDATKESSRCGNPALYQLYSGKRRRRRSARKGSA